MFMIFLDCFPHMILWNSYWLFWIFYDSLGFFSSTYPFHYSYHSHNHTRWWEEEEVSFQHCSAFENIPSESTWGKLELYDKHGLLFAFPSSNHFGMKSTLEKKSNCHRQQPLKTAIGIGEHCSLTKWRQGGGCFGWQEELLVRGRQRPSWPTSAVLKARGEATKTQQKLVEFSRAANKYFHKKASWRSALGLRPEPGQRTLIQRIKEFTPR